MKRKYFGFAALASSITLVAGCSTSITMDAASVTQFDNGEEWIMTGELEGMMDGSSITRLSGGGVNCEMHQKRQPDRSTAGVMTCVDQDGKVVYNQRQVIPAEKVTMSFSGTYVDELTVPSLGHGLMAFGWGKKADAQALRALLP